MLSASGRYITVKNLKVTGTNLVATEDQENTSSGSLDITTTPSNQPYMMVYIDHKHLMPFMTAETPFPSCGSSIPPRANAELPHAFSTGPAGYWETADADPMNTPFVKFHHANSKGFKYEVSPNMSLPVTAVISDGTSGGSFLGCPMHPDGPDKFYKLGGLPGPEGLVGHHTLPLDNIAATNAYANRYDNIPLSGVPNYMCSNISARLNNMDRPAGQTNTTIEANLNSDLMGRKMDSRIGQVQAAEVSAASGPTGQIFVKEQVTYQGDQFNTQRPPSHIAGEGREMPIIDKSKQATEEDRIDGGHGVKKDFKIKAGDFQNYYQQGMNLSNMNYGTAIPYQESIPLMMVKPAPFQTPTGKMHPYSFCVVFSFEATIEVHRNHTRYNYLHSGTRPAKTAVYAGCNVHSGVKTFPQRAWCLG